MPPRPIRKPPAPVTPIARAANTCPHCRLGVLEETTQTHTDTGRGDAPRTGGKPVTVFECSACDYTEGR
jgi:hypothetical protein